MAVPSVIMMLEKYISHLGVAGWAACETVHGAMLTESRNLPISVWCAGVCKDRDCLKTDMRWTESGGLSWWCTHSTGGCCSERPPPQQACLPSSSANVSSLIQPLEEIQEKPHKHYRLEVLSGLVFSAS